MKKVAKKKEITMDDLAMMTQRGFDGVDKRFDGVYKRFDGVDKRLNSMEERLERIEAKVTVAHDNRLDKIEDKLQIIKTLFETKLSIPFPK